MKRRSSKYQYKRTVWDKNSDGRPIDDYGNPIGLYIPKGSRLSGDHYNNHNGNSFSHNNDLSRKGVSHGISSSEKSRYKLMVDHYAKKYIKPLVTKVLGKFKIDIKDYELEQSRQDAALTSVVYLKKKGDYNKYYKALNDNSEYTSIINTVEKAANNAKRAVASSSTREGASKGLKLFPTQVIPEDLRPYFQYEKDYSSEYQKFPINKYTYRSGTILGCTVKVNSMLNKIMTKLSENEQKEETEQKDQEVSNLNQSSAQDEENENQEENIEENNQVENTNQSNTQSSNNSGQSQNPTEENEDDEDDGKQEEKDDTDNEDEDDQKDEHKDEIEEKESGENQLFQQNSNSQSNAMPQTPEELLAMFQQLKAEFERVKRANQQKDQIIDSQTNTIKQKDDTIKLQGDKLKSKDKRIEDKEKIVNAITETKDTFKTLYISTKEKLEQKTEEYDNLKEQLDNNDDQRSISSFVNLSQQQEEKNDTELTGVNDDHVVESL